MNQQTTQFGRIIQHWQDDYVFHIHSSDLAICKYDMATINSQVPKQAEKENTKK